MINRVDAVIPAHNNRNKEGKLVHPALLKSLKEGKSFAACLQEEIKRLEAVYK